MPTGRQFEVPTVLQASHQWAYDPHSAQKDPALIVANLMLLTAKRGNYLVNVALDPTGVWPPAAVAAIDAIGDWLGTNGEAIFNTTPVYPYAFPGGFVTAGNRCLYVLLPATTPTTLAGRDSANATLYLPFVRSGLLSAPVSDVAMLGSPGTVTYTVNSTGMTLSFPAPQPSAVPLRSYFSAANNDTAPCGLRDSGTCSVYTQADYTLLRTEAYCFSNALPGQATVQMQLLFDGAITDNALGNSSTAASLPAYAQIDTECFMYASPAADRVAVELWWSEARQDLWALAADASRAQAKSSGYVYNATIGYALPASPAPAPSPPHLGTVFKISF